MMQRFPDTGVGTDLLPLPGADRGDDESSPRVSVVIPTRNEAKNLPYVLSRLPDGLHEVIVVDGHSVDDTVAVAQQERPDVRVLVQDRPGRSAAMAAGFLHATGDILVSLEAHGSADPRSIPRLVAPLLHGADYVGGSTREGRRARGPHPPSAAGRWIASPAGLLRRTGVDDGSSRHSAFWARSLVELGLDDALQRLLEGRRRGHGLGVEELIYRRVARAGLWIVEVPVPACPHVPRNSRMQA
jgi:glycosyltransferase involved in cell wall biosynthesis